MQIVIAGNYSQYKNFLRENNLTPKDARYVCKREDILGLRSPAVRFYGTYWNNPLSEDPYLRAMLRRTMVVK